MEKKKIKILKPILIILLILLILFVINTSRKMIIMKNIENKAKLYSEYTNYHIKTYQYQGSSLCICETFLKDNNSLTTVSNISNNQTAKISILRKDDNYTTYIDGPEQKTVIPNSNGIPSDSEICNLLYTENLWQFIVRSIRSSIRTKECNGKQCYEIRLSCFDLTCLEEHPDIFIFEKETGLLVRKFNGSVVSENETTDMVFDYYYEFNTVTDENLIIQNSEEYVIQENN